jgi:tetratricopeptide (TPR) repeat protein
VDQIIRICSLAMLSVVLTASGASAREGDTSALGQYFEARIADSAGDTELSSQRYAAALTAAPGNQLVALRAFRQAIRAGDEKLALRAAHQLEAANTLPADARLLLLSEKLSGGDWRGARLTIDKIEEDGSLEFLSPMLRAWTAVAARESNPLAPLDGVPRGSLATAYASEHRALIQFARRQFAEGATTIKSMATSELRLAPLKISAAASLVRAGNKAGALELLDGDDPALIAASARVTQGKPLPGAVDTAPKGVAMLYARVASDLLRDRVPGFALTMARLAGFIDPVNDQIRLVEAQALAANKKTAAASALLQRLPEDSLYRREAREASVALLEQAGRPDDAVGVARALASQIDAGLEDQVRLGSLLTRLGRDADAAAAFKNAIALADRGGGNADTVPWALWLYYGGALEQAGNWEEARAALQKAAKLAPDQPAPLNHLGYAMLERRENLPEATRLIALASALKPNDPAITDSLGWAYFLAGDHEKAIRTLERAVLAEPTTSALGEHLGDAYWTVGRRIDARYAWSAALIHADGRDAKRLAEKIDLGLTNATAAR